VLHQKRRQPGLAKKAARKASFMGLAPAFHQGPGRCSPTPCPFLRDAPLRTPYLRFLLVRPALCLQASFGSRIAPDTLAARPAVPTPRAAEDVHIQVFDRAAERCLTAPAMPRTQKRGRSDAAPSTCSPTSHPVNSGSASRARGNGHEHLDGRRTGPPDGRRAGPPDGRKPGPPDGRRPWRAVPPPERLAGRKPEADSSSA
jgi:hypothetical protein